MKPLWKPFFKNCNILPFPFIIGQLDLIFVAESTNFIISLQANIGFESRPDTLQNELPQSQGQKASTGKKTHKMARFYEVRMDGLYY
jgi:hypothetical protein